MDKESLESTLSLLRQARSRLVSRFTSHDVELLGDMFRFERSPALMALAVDKLNVWWISDHYELIDAFENSVSPETKNAFNVCLIALIDWLDNACQRGPSTELALVRDLIAEKKKLLAAQFAFSNKDDANYKKLVYAKHREAALFERLFAQAIESEK